MMKCDNISITEASIDDVGEILALLTRVDLPRDGVPENVDAFLVARNEVSQLVAIVGLERHGSIGLLRSAAVAPEFQRSGIGSLMIQRLLERATKEGLEKVVLLTSTASEFFGNRFKFCETSRKYYDEALAESSEWKLPRCSTAVCMSLSLGSKSANRER